jgi:hypothetical protein
MKKYIIDVDWGIKGYNRIGNIFVVLYECLKHIDSGARILVVSKKSPWSSVISSLKK